MYIIIIQNKAYYLRLTAILLFSGGVKMTIEKLSSLTVKVSVTDNELSHFELSFEQLENHDKNTRDLIAYALHEIRNHLGLNLYNEHLYIEAFSCSTCGCILYISVIDSSIYEEPPSGSLFPEELMFETGSEKTIIRFSGDLDKYFTDTHNSSKLFYNNNIFRLIYSINKDFDYDIAESIIDTAENYNIRYYTDRIAIAYTEEYYCCIIESDAVPKLAGKQLF